MNHDQACGLAGRGTRINLLLEAEQLYGGVPCSLRLLVIALRFVHLDASNSMLDMYPLQPWAGIRLSVRPQR